MTLADMSVITSEVKVDENRHRQRSPRPAADVTIDAIPHKVFHGIVSEIGDNAIVRLNWCSYIAGYLDERRSEGLQSGCDAHRSATGLAPRPLFDG